MKPPFSAPLVTTNWFSVALIFLFVFIFFLDSIYELNHMVFVFVYGEDNHHENEVNSPGWCGSVDRAPVCKPKGFWFDSQSGYLPGLQVRSPVGDMREATD